MSLVMIISMDMCYFEMRPIQCIILCIHVGICIYVCVCVYIQVNLWVYISALAKEPYKRDNILQKRPVI